MRKYSIVFAAIVLLILVLANVSTVPDDTNRPGEDQADSIEYADLGGPDDIKLYPIDEANQNVEFQEFRDRLVAAAQERDLEFLREHIDNNIRYTFGVNDRIEGFLREWKLDSNPGESAFWDELIQVLQLGGTFDDGKNLSFTAPYVFTRFPEDIDAFQHVVVIDRDVKVYAESDPASEILGTLTYSIVRLLERVTSSGTENGGKHRWLKIQTLSGNSGFILAKYGRSPIDYRGRWKNIDGTWKLVLFVAGD